MIYNVPFISNTSDDLHCQQAAYMMVLKFFRPETNIDFEAWDEITGFEKNKGTWATASLLWFKDQGFKVKHLSLFNMEKFVKKGGEYLIESAGEKVGQWQIQHSNLPLEQKRAKQLINSGIYVEKEPTKQDIIKFLDDGYLARVLVNARKLNNKKGYAGHAVVVIGYDDNGFTLHDPGLPPQQRRKVSFQNFENAWADPNKEAKELDAIRL